jgi:peptide deformylase
MDDFDYESYYNAGKYCIIPGSGVAYCQERYCRGCKRYLVWNAAGRPPHVPPHLRRDTALVAGPDGVPVVPAEQRVLYVSPEMNPPKPVKWALVVDPDPGLRLPSKPVDGIDDHVREVAEFLVSVLGGSPESGGVAGCAAPQFGVHLRIIAFWRDTVTRLACINPAVKAVGADTVVVYERCISVPGTTARVRRPKVVKFAATGMDGRPLSLKLRERDAQLVCHEIDHLDGILCTDRERELREQERTAEGSPR